MMELRLLKTLSNGRCPMGEVQDGEEPGVNAASPTGGIESGIDAIVLGASFDGMVAAARLGKAGLKTILFEQETKEESDASAGQSITADSLLSMLDSKVVSELELYRMGLNYAARRLDSIYFMDEGETISLDGDFHGASQHLDDAEIEPFSDFSKKILNAAAVVALPAGARVNGQATNSDHDDFAFRVGAVDEILSATLPRVPLRTAMAAECVYGFDCAPSEPFSFGGMLSRMSGEIAGLPGAMAYADGGLSGVMQTVRRAVQANKVDVRRTPSVQEILIEQDGVAGVRLASGGQIRAPNVISALNANETFLDLVGAGQLGVEFQSALSVPEPRVAKVQLQLEITGAVTDERTLQLMRKRIVYAPPAHAMSEAIFQARRGQVPDAMILEIFFPDVLAGREETETYSIIVTAHPLPIEMADGKKRKAQVEKTILSLVDRIAPNVRKRIQSQSLLTADDMSKRDTPMGWLNAQRPVMQQMALAQKLKNASGVSGLYFCGSEVGVGGPLCGRAGLQAARATIDGRRRREAR